MSLGTRGLLGAEDPGGVDRLLGRVVAAVSLGGLRELGRGPRVGSLVEVDAVWSVVEIAGGSVAEGGVVADDAGGLSLGRFLLG